MIPALLAAALAAPMGELPVQGQLADAAGVPVHGSVDITFSLYADTTRAEVLWTRTLPGLTVDHGAFTVRLTDVDLVWFRDHPSMVLGIRVGADPEMDPVPLGHVPYAGWAAYAGDAATLQGRTADSFKDADWTPSWSDLRDLPADLSDGDDVGVYLAGDGLLLNGDTFALDPAAVTNLCFDHEEELRAALDDAYLAAGWRPAWGDLADVPADLADGDDVGVYTAGAGLSLTGDRFDLDLTAVQGAARDVCYDSEAELRAVLDDLYLAAGWTPSWTDLSDIPADLLDGDDGSVYVAGDGLVLTGDRFSLDPEAVTGLCYDTEAELRAALAGAFLPADHTPAWADLTGVPADLADGDDVGVYTAGSGLSLTGDRFDLDPAAVQAGARAVCYDTEAELRAALDDVYLAAGWTPSWTDLSGIPADLADGDDVGVYTAGTGLSLTGNRFDLDTTAVQSAARAVCYDSEAELHAALDDDYLAADYAPAWTDLTGVPADLADGDQNTTYVAGTGLDLAGNTFSLDTAAVRGLCFDTEAELTAALNDNYLSTSYAPAWNTITGVPADLADGDANTTYVAGTGLNLSGNSFSLNTATVQGICYDTEAELTTVLNDNYLASSYRPPWSQLTGVPADIADGDQNTTYTAGTGLRLTGTQFSTDDAWLETVAQDVVDADDSLVRTPKTTGISMSTAWFYRDANQLIYRSASGTEYRLDFSGIAATQTMFSSGDRIALQRTSGQDSKIYLDITDMPGSACSLLGYDNDYARPGTYTATDGGNNAGAIWPSGGKSTFQIGREGNQAYVIESAESFVIMCVSF